MLWILRYVYFHKSIRTFIFLKIFYGNHLSNFTNTHDYISLVLVYVCVGWKYTYLRSPTSFRIEKKEGDQSYI